MSLENRSHLVKMPGGKLRHQSNLTMTFKLERDGVASLIGENPVIIKGNGVNFFQSNYSFQLDSAEIYSVYPVEFELGIVVGPEARFISRQQFAGRMHSFPVCIEQQFCPVQQFQVKGVFLSADVGPATLFLSGFLRKPFD